MTRPLRLPYTAEEDALIVRMRQAGALWHQIDEALGRCADSARTRAVKVGLDVPRLGPARWSAEALAGLRRRVAACESASQISRALGVTTSAVIGQCYRLGLKLQGHKAPAGKPAAAAIDRSTNDTPAKPHCAPKPAPQPNGAGLPIIALRRDQCRRPSAPREERVICARPQRLASFRALA
jgi:hypothetical protein